MRFAIARFTKHVSAKNQGSVTLGFMDLAVKSDDGVEQLTLHDFTVRLNRDGQLSLSAPKREYETSRGTRTKSAFKFTDERYAALVNGLAQTPAIAEAIEEGLAARAEHDVQEPAVPEQVDIAM